MFGFKSFGFKNTTVDFQPGLISISGPNGSGKSNILDAIIFALGENRKKTMKETPFFFSNGSYNLFGILHEPEIEPNGEGFVFCHPFAEEIEVELGVLNAAFVEDVRIFDDFALHDCLLSVSCPQSVGLLRSHRIGGSFGQPLGRRPDPAHDLLDRSLELRVLP